MNEELELFRWFRHGGGYQWQDNSVFAPDHQKNLDQAVLAETRFLVPRPMEEPGRWRYHPMRDHPTLFREFANLDSTEEAFAAFADAYGDLGVGVIINVPNAIVEAADPLCRWHAAHLRMRVVADVLTALNSRDAKALRQWFSISNNAASFQRDDGVARWFARVAIAEEMRDYIWKWIAAADSDDEAIVRAAHGWAQETINDAIDGENDIATVSTARIVFDQDRQRMTLRLTPHTLLGAMWFQCARVLTLNPSFRTCDKCLKWFELSPDRRRRQAIYCSDRCKVAAYRERKALNQASPFA